MSGGHGLTGAKHKAVLWSPKARRKRAATMAAKFAAGFVPGKGWPDGNGGWISEKQKRAEQGRGKTSNLPAISKAVESVMPLHLIPERKKSKSLYVPVAKRPGHPKYNGGTVVLADGDRLQLADKVIDLLTNILGGQVKSK